MSQRFFEGALHAAVYAKFRPLPPKQLGERIIFLLKEKYKGNLDLCVDVGCGSGQSSTLFAPFFQKVIATDISASQIAVAKTLIYPSNVDFLTCPAEQIPAEDGSVQLVSASQACHWFDLPKFFKETSRVLCKNGLSVLSGYTFPRFFHETKADDLQKALDLLYHGRTGPYWGAGREHVDNEYKDITIPFCDFKREELWTDVTSLTLAEFVGYITTWSGYQNFCKANGDAKGLEILQEFISSCQRILGTSEDPNKVELNIMRKYFLLIGRWD